MSMFRQRILWTPIYPPQGGDIIEPTAAEVEAIDLAQVIHPKQSEGNADQPPSKNSEPEYSAKPKLLLNSGIIHMEENGGGIYFDPTQFPDCSRVTQSVLAERLIEACGGRMFAKVKEYASKTRKRIRFTCGSCSGGDEDVKCQFTFQINYAPDPAKRDTETKGWNPPKGGQTGKWFMKRNKGSFVHSCGLLVPEDKVEKYLVPIPPISTQQAVKYGSAFCSVGFPKDHKERRPMEKSPTSTPSPSPAEDIGGAVVAATSEDKDQEAGTPEDTSKYKASFSVKEEPITEVYCEIPSLPMSAADPAPMDEQEPELTKSSKRKESPSQEDSPKENTPGSPNRKKMKKEKHNRYLSPFHPSHDLLVDPPRPPSPPPLATQGTDPPVDSAVLAVAATSSPHISSPPSPAPKVSQTSLFNATAVTGPQPPKKGEDLIAPRPGAPEYFAKHIHNITSPTSTQEHSKLRDGSAHETLYGTNRKGTSPSEQLFLLSLAASALAARETEDGDEDGNDADDGDTKQKVAVCGASAEFSDDGAISEDDGHVFQDKDGDPDDPNKERVSTSVFWMRRFNELKAFRDAHGHCLVPQTYKPNPALGNWVKNQRAQYKIWQYLQNKPHTEDKDRPYRKTCSLNAERIRLLQEIGFQWRVSAVSKQKQRKSAIMMNSVEDHHVHDESKRKAKKEKKEKHRRDKKEEDDWMNMFSELEDFQKKYGSCPLSRKHIEERSANPRLWPWMTEQRKQWKLFKGAKASQLSAERIYMLERLSFAWEPPAPQVLAAHDFAEDDCDADWMEHYEELRDYIQKHGVFPSPGYSALLTGWVQKQQNQYKRFQENQQSFMTRERIHLLEQLHFPWEPAALPQMLPTKIPGPDVSDQNWLNMYNELKSYHYQQGDCFVPFHGRNIALLDWIAQQRRDYVQALRDGFDHSRMTAEKCTLLEKLGFEWDDKEAAWMTNFVELGRHVRMHGFGSLPPRESHSLLWHWMSEQSVWFYSNRENVPGSVLTTRRRELLDMLGFPWARLMEELRSE